MAPTGIKIRFDFSSTAEQMRVIAMPWGEGETVVTIDGEPHVMPYADELTILCAPGMRRVEVHFDAHPGRFSVGVANLLTHGKLGLEVLDVEVDEGTVRALHYAANAFWYYGGSGAKLTLDPAAQ